jgi:putative phosphoribosyl transferase
MPRFAAEPLFADRAEAGERLAGPVGEVVAGRPAVVLAIPRGGVEVGAVLARRLDAPLDVVVPRKIGAPGNPELGLGAVADEVEVLDPGLVRRLRVSPRYLEAEILAQRAEIARRLRVYRGDRAPVEPAGRVAVVVDDGVATGGTAVAALRWARARDAAEVVLAVPVAPSESLARLAAESDEVVVLASPEPFFAVGQWYASFPQTDDGRVVELLEAAGSR